MMVILILAVIISALVFRTSPVEEARWAEAMKLTQKSFPFHLV